MAYIKKTTLFFALVIFCFGNSLIASDTIFISGNQTEIKIIDKIQLYEDKSNATQISDILDVNNFQLNKEATLNFGFSKSTHWMKICLSNMSDEKVEYLLSINNSDLDTIEYYELLNDSLIEAHKTGEVFNKNTRDIPHMKFIFELNLEKGQTKNLFIKVNNKGESTYVPISLMKKDFFWQYNTRETSMLWLLYGILIFILIFNLYLYQSLKEKINLVYSVYLLFGILFLWALDGLHFIFGIPSIMSKLKLVFPAFWLYFLVIFSQIFLETEKKYKVFHNILRIIKIVLVIIIPISFLPYPFTVISIFTVEISSVIVFGALLYGSIVAYNKNFLPSVYFFWAIVAVFAGVITFLFKEAGWLPSYQIVENSARIGLTLESTILTFAVIERFRYQQDEAKKTIEKSNRQINAQKEILQEINVELEKLSIVASETDNGVSIYNNNLELEYCNSGFERLYEQDLDSIKKTGNYNIKNIGIFNDCRNFVDACLKTKKPVLFENNYKSESGILIWLQTVISPYLDSNNKILKCIVIDTDITKQKNYEHELTVAKERAEQSDKLKSAFLSNMSHEIRTPLNAILGFSELVLNRNQTEERKKTYLTLVRTNGHHLLKLISDILDISKIQSGDIKVFNSKGDINKMMNELFAYYELDIQNRHSKKIELQIKTLPDDVETLVNSDHSKLRQVLDNFIGNAIKFTEEGEIEFGVNLEQDKLHFYVRDTGIGIPDNDKEKIFERFQQVELGLSRRYEGTGLGLAISKGLILRIGGQIWLDSKLGEGSTFHFTVPYIPANTGEKKPENNIDLVNKLANFSILVVEDIEDNFLLIKEMLAETGAGIHHAIDGKSSLEMVLRDKYSMILMDLRLPDIDGVQATKLIRKYFPNIPIIAQTANISDDEKAKCLENGFNDFISKPIDRNQLLTILKKYLIAKKNSKAIEK